MSTNSQFYVAATSALIATAGADALHVAAPFNILIGFGAYLVVALLGYLWRRIPQAQA
jgi:hypothetical protein